MTMRNHCSRHRHWWMIGSALGLSLITAAALAQTHHSGGSTTVIEQHGAGPSQSQVSVYRDGQKVITRDGQNTDISIQRGSTGVPSGSADSGRFEFDERLVPSRPSERLTPHRRAAGEILEPWSDVEPSREAFRQRMLERLRSSERF
ncbi:hypothetical protein ABC977_08610 [Thioalkalicoccus limnaeus]|uniref:Uncharacterized protein n=1 Tax=Thioalkalicoccus limnaeus TaxID=120681 RepID=A0ABV4BGP9_9GAMM